MKHADLVERVARQMAVENCDYDDGELVFIPYIEDARAVVATVFEALKEPTPEMMGAAQSAWLADPQRRTTTLYAAMLSASPLNPER